MMCFHWHRCFGVVEKELRPYYLAESSALLKPSDNEMYLLRPSRHAEMAAATPSTPPTPRKNILLYISFYCAYVDYFFVSSKMEQSETCAEMYAEEFILR